MTRVCWLLGHKYIEEVRTGEVGKGLYRLTAVSPPELIEVPLVRLEQTEFCVRCGKDRPKP